MYEMHAMLELDFVLHTNSSCFKYVTLILHSNMLECIYIIKTRFILLLLVAFGYLSFSSYYILYYNTLYY